MSKFKHEFHERGNGFPSVGDDVLIEDKNGWHALARVRHVSRIQTMQWHANYVYLALEESDRDYGDLDEVEQDQAWKDLYHVVEISDDE